jgi:hypothetical protein
MNTQKAALLTMQQRSGFACAKKQGECSELKILVNQIKLLSRTYDDPYSAAGLRSFSRAALGAVRLPDAKVAAAPSMSCRCQLLDKGLLTASGNSR